MTSYIGKIISRVYGEDIIQKDAELAKRDEEIIQKDAEITRLMQLLSQRDAELAQNAIVLNDVTQELLSVKQELAQRDAELVQERICLRDRTLPAPINIQVKLNEMFKSWDKLSVMGGSITTWLIPPLLPKIRAATEQIKEPIMGLFHVTYGHYGSFRCMYTDAMLFTATDVYYLTNGVTNPESGDPSNDIRQVVIEDISGVFMQNSTWKSRYAFTDPKWVKWTAINKEANFKKIITNINHLSGYTGTDYPQSYSNTSFNNSGSMTAMERIRLLHAVIF